ncbi:hypothetical protein WN51_03859 [Melipona quadrifasciata]|uniref:Uncharacterized protein n=1 Tax=Melipona quadrifasciata TaxID=166423 RepID=A0A0M9AAX7_9HYME|nr:hypothetical protein WN51_03859 [Melipona quadrifasciata]
MAEDHILSTISKIIQDTVFVYLDKIQGAARYPLGPATSRRTETGMRRRRAFSSPCVKVADFASEWPAFRAFLCLWKLARIQYRFGQSRLSTSGRYIPRLTIPSTEKVEQERGQRRKKRDEPGRKNEEGVAGCAVTGTFTLERAVESKGTSTYEKFPYDEILNSSGGVGNDDISTMPAASHRCRAVRQDTEPFYLGCPVCSKYSGTSIIRPHDEPRYTQRGLAQQMLFTILLTIMLQQISLGSDIKNRSFIEFLKKEERVTEQLLELEQNLTLNDYRDRQVQNGTLIARINEATTTIAVIKRRFAKMKEDREGSLEFCKWLYL